MPLLMEQEERSQVQNREKCMQMLASKLYQIEQARIRSSENTALLGLQAEMLKAHFTALDIYVFSTTSTTPPFSTQTASQGPRITPKLWGCLPMRRATALT